MDNYSDEYLKIDGVFGIINDGADNCIGNHTHDFLELKYITSGTATEYIDGQAYDVEKGSMIFVNYGQTHSFASDSVFSYINFMLKPEFISSTLMSSDNSFDILSLSVFGEFSEDEFDYKPVVKFAGKDMIMIERLIDIMLEEYNNREKGYKSVLSGSMKMIFSLFIRKMYVGEYKDVMRHVKRFTPDILKYIDDNCYEISSIKQLAEKCFYNPAYFSRMFKKCYSIDLKTYINEKRIDKAVELLKTTDMSVENICYKVGFFDKKQFYKIFKQYMGIMPGDIRK